MGTDWRSRLRDVLREPVAGGMVWLSYVFTIIVAMGLQRAVGVTHFLLETPPRRHEMLAFQAAILILWPCFIFEFIAYWLARQRGEKFWRMHWPGLFVCLLPPLRMGALRHVHNGELLLPRLGWQEPTKELRRGLERFFSGPMIIIALMILPLLAIEFLYVEAVKNRLWLAIALDIATGFIWLAFTVEFILNFSIARKRVRYLQRHWLDVAIITLPFITFLAWLRAFRVLRLARLTYVTRMTRLYRLRGLAIRLLRAMLLLGMVQRILYRTPDKRLARLREQVIEKQWEIADIREEILRTIEELKSPSRNQAAKPSATSKDEPAEAESSACDDLTIRPATDDDARAIASLILELGYPANAAAVRHCLEQYASTHHDGDNHDGHSDDIHQEHRGVLIAQLHDEVVGFISLISLPLFHRPQRICRVATMVVAETHRGKGIGAALIDEAQAHARRWQCERLEVTCAEHRTEAHAFYQSLGFTPHAHRFLKDLPPRK